MKNRLKFHLCSAVIVSFLAGTALARGGGRHSGAQQKGGVPSRNISEEQYEAGLSDFCAEQEESRDKALKAHQVVFYSEECLPISVSTRQMKRQGEKKHFSECEAKRTEERSQAQTKARIHLKDDCFNWIPDLAIDVEVGSVIDPIYRSPPDGIWKKVSFFSCDMLLKCTLLSSANR